MGRVIMNGPPDSADPAGWCVICLCQAKQKQWELEQDKVKAGHEAPGDILTVIPWLDGLTKELRPGAYRAVAGDAPTLGVIDGLCWDHIAGIAPPRTSMIAPADGVIPPGLLKGRG